MQFPIESRTGVASILMVLLCQVAAGQGTPAREAMSITPRATPADYQAQAQAGTMTIAAEFTGHSIATPQAILSTEDHVVVEVGLFGPPDARIKLAHEDFSLRINGRKTPLPAQPYGLVSKSAKDPEWEALEPPETKKSKTSMATGGGGGDSDPPRPFHVPVELKRALEQRVQKASLPEGDRVLPEAGLIYFEYGGKVTGIRSIELIYEGAAGKATLTLHP